MKHLFFFIITKFVFSQNVAYERFQEYVKSPKGCVLHIKFNQSYYDETSILNGVFYKKGETYIYDDSRQYVKYENQAITTINKLINKIIFDTMNKNNATIFDILSGNKQNIFFYPSVTEKDRINIPFEIELWGMRDLFGQIKLMEPQKKSVLHKTMTLK